MLEGFDSACGFKTGATGVEDAAGVATLVGGTVTGACTGVPMVEDGLVRGAAGTCGNLASATGAEQLDVGTRETGGVVVGTEAGAMGRAILDTLGTSGFCGMLSDTGGALRVSHEDPWPRFSAAGIEPFNMMGSGSSIGNPLGDVILERGLTCNPRLSYAW